MKEASARIKINKLLEEAGWRFLPSDDGPANIVLEANTPLLLHDLDKLGDDFQQTNNGFIDFLLLDAKGHPLLVLEAKAEDKDPLIGKEKARRYAKNQNCRFVILSNGNLHYFWDLERGNPHIITSFPQPESVEGYTAIEPNPELLADESVNSDYIVLTQRPGYRSEAAWQNESERPAYIRAHGLRFLRPYQLQAVQAIQTAVTEGNDRFLLEMATGTGKTLVAAAIIKLFLRTRNAHRVLFLVDRLELEDQAAKQFGQLLANDATTVVYKENKDDWKKAEIVVTTVQSLLSNNKYRTLFSPTDFDLVISDEAHRSIGGNARSVFEYFVGYKLGLTATPRDYLKGTPSRYLTDQREVERRLLLDTYRTFGCESGEPTFRYSLIDGVKDGYLINPTVVDARTEVTTQLLSDEGFTATIIDDTGEDQEETFKQREFERRFFSDATNLLLCKTFLENSLRDPISGEIGKAIVFAVSQRHAAKLTQILNQIADRMYPGKYHSDFAVQVTSQIEDAQQFARNFANNNLLGSANFVDGYKTSKARVCVTVGMMTTGYDCTDLLNIGLFRPIFSPTDFVQIKGRGTRRHNFLDQLTDPVMREEIGESEKTAYKLFDFFANCEYFEEDFDYDEELKLPKQHPGKPSETDPEPRAAITGTFEHLGADILASIREQQVGYEGMKIDRKLFEKFESRVRSDKNITEAVEAGDWQRVIDYVNRELFDKPEEYYTLEKLRQAAPVDRRVSLQEILEVALGRISGFKSKDQLLEEEFAKFVADQKPDDPVSIPAIRNFFKAYATSDEIRNIIDNGKLTDLATNPMLSTADFKSVPVRFRRSVPEYIKDYVSLNQFAP